MSDNTVVTENTITNVIEVTSAGPAGPPGGALTIQDEGVDEGLLTDKINFVGSTVSVVNDTEAEIATITVNAADPGANTNITSLGGITGGISSPDYVQFDTAASAAGAVGRLLWNDTDGTLEFQLKGGNVTLQIGQEQVVRVTNKSGVTMTDGQAVYITGSTGNHLNVTLAQANTEATSSKTLAIVTETIAKNGTGFATSAGLVRGINTSALTEGAAIWLSPTVPGGLTTTRPTAPDHAVLIGWCVRQSATVGAIFVHIANGYELDELHDVLITAAANNQVLRYDATTNLWKNATISPTLTLAGDVSGSATFTDLGNATLTATVADDSHNHIISNVDGLQTALDSKFNANSTTDALTEGSTNLYFTTARVRASLSAGTGLTYNSTTGVITNSAPDQTIAITGGGTTTVTGTYPNFTVSSADQYVGTVTSVSGTGTVNGLTLTGTVTSSGSLTLGGTLSVDLSTSTVTGTLSVANGGTGTTTQFTAGSVVFAGASGVYSQDNAQLFWDDTNNRLGIGTSSPGYKLTVSGGATSLAANQYLRFGAGPFAAGDGSLTNYLFSGSTSMTWRNAADSADLMYLSNGGNLGLGVTPKTWTTYQAIDVGASGGYVVNSTAGGFIGVGQNFNYNGGYQYAGSAAASFYYQQAGSHIWQTAPSGTAGNAISFTQAMTLDASGNLGVGTSSPPYKLTVSNGGYEGFEVSPGYSSGFVLLQAYNRATGSYSVMDYAGSYFRWLVSGSEKMRIDSSGNVGIGTSSPSLPLDVQSTGVGSTIAARIFRSDGTVALLRIGNSTSGSDSSAPAFGSDTTAAVVYTNNTERMRIHSSGYISLGSGAAVQNGLLVFPGDISGTPFRRGIKLSADPDGYFDFYVNSNQNNPVFRWFNGNGSVELMRLNGATGNLGIGTSSPSVKLDVSGGHIRMDDGYKLRWGDGTAAWEGSGASDVLIGYTNNTERMRIDSSGNLLVGTTSTSAPSNGFVFSPGSQLASIGHVNGTGSGANYTAYYYNTTLIGGITQDGTTGVLYNTSSDARLKENIADADDAANLIDAIQVRKFDWKADGSHQRYGMVAQELLEVAPEAVSVPADEGEMMGVDYSKLVPMLVKEIQSLRARVAQLEGN